jgi:hypothetical protein
MTLIQTVEYIGLSFEKHDPDPKKYNTIQCIPISASFSRDKDSIMNPVPHNVFLSAVFRRDKGPF